MSNERPKPGTRADYRHFMAIPTRWMDNDVYGHVNNVNYYSYFDTLINRYLIDAGRLDFRDGAVIGLAVSHRVGLLPVGHTAIVVAVSSAHRSRAFEVCRELVETVKAELPVWKREILLDGTHTWVGLDTSADQT